MERHTMESISITYGIIVHDYVILIQHAEKFTDNYFKY